MRDLLKPNLGFLLGLGNLLEEIDDFVDGGGHDGAMECAGSGLPHSIEGFKAGNSEQLSQITE